MKKGKQPTNQFHALIGGGTRLIARGLLGAAAYRLSQAASWCGGLRRSLELSEYARTDEQLAYEREACEDTLVSPADVETAGSFGANFNIQ